MKRLPILVVLVGLSSAACDPFTGRIAMPVADDQEFGAPGDDSDLVVEAVGPRFPGPCIVATRVDDDENTGFSTRTSFAYDEAGRQTDVWYDDEDADAAPNLHEYRTLDALGRPLSEHVDVGDDGEVDATTTYVRTDDEPSRWEALMDQDQDGDIDSVRRGVTRADGQPIYEELDAENDGEFEQRIDYGVDELGRHAATRIRDLVGGTTLALQTILYVGDGTRLQEVLIDWGGDGTDEERTVFEYDRYDHRIAMQTELRTGGPDGTGAVVLRTEDEVDAAGNVLRRQTMYFDGTPGTESLFDYSCF